MLPFYSTRLWDLDGQKERISIGVGDTATGTSPGVERCQSILLLLLLLMRMEPNLHSSISPYTRWKRFASSSVRMRNRKEHHQVLMVTPTSSPRLVSRSPTPTGVWARSTSLFRKEPHWCRLYGFVFDIFKWDAIMWKKIPRSSGSFFRPILHTSPHTCSWRPNEWTDVALVATWMNKRNMNECW